MIPQSKSVVRSIGKLSNKIRRKIDGLSSKQEFSGAEGKLLHFILAQPGDIFQRDIEEEFVLRPPTATQLLKKMELNGLICRETTSYDARLKRIIATEKALRYKDPVMHDLENLESAATSGISEEELEQFYKTIEKIMKNLS